MRLVVFSDQPGDHELGKKVAEICSAKARVEVASCASLKELTNLFASSLQTVLLWSIDGQGQDEASTQTRLIAQYLAPEQVFLFSSKQIVTGSALVGSNVFGHFFLRTEDENFPRTIARLIFACYNTKIAEIYAALADGASVKKIELKSTNQRKAAIQAIENILEKKEVPDRICKKVAKGTDELLMNALYRAPRDSSGRAYRADASTLENEDHALVGQESVELEFINHPDFFAISVCDHFGSLSRKDVQYHFTRDYQNAEYSMKHGLGIFQTFQGGLSVLFLVRAAKKTQAWIFAPWSKSYKEFQGSFHFFSFIFEK
ncbi:MAG: hypothetical protein P4M08_01960 [Oligoflexia bacterium]|nr:hypothetical protein [Oligoflexia bacterium]